MRKSNFFLLYLVFNLAVMLALSAHAGFHQHKAATHLAHNGELVEKLQLTDLCLFTEASYTRHLTQADADTPFQDNPVSLEHFPSGSLLMPPEVVKRPYGNTD